MFKQMNEIRDPIHVFIKLSNDERKVLDSRPFQRLRYIHQLAMTYLVYPGASHTRFEHSLGVMELASRVYDVVTDPCTIHENIRSLIPEITDEDQRRYWRHVIRIAALCHDLGHLPFSHAAENELLPEGWDHERLTKAIILSEEMAKIWKKMTPYIREEDIVKISLGPRKALEYTFTDWESVLSEIIVGDALGVDRIDYLLRDSHHIGVAYGKFDHYRLIDTMRILPTPPSRPESENTREPSLGIEEGGLQSAEALLIARYFMFSQVYFHHVRRIYDIHLKDFLKEWLEGQHFSNNINEHLAMTDNEVLKALREASCNSHCNGHIHAERIMNHEHYKVLYKLDHNDQKINKESVLAVYYAACCEFDRDLIKCDIYTPKGQNTHFPVLIDKENTVSSLSLSTVLQNLPDSKIGYVFAAPSILKEAKSWLKKQKETIIKPPIEEIDNDGIASQE